MTPVSSNTAVEKSGLFDQVYRTRIGSPYVIEQMNKAMSAHDSVGGYEANGGFLLATNATHEGRVLNALPTRDAILPILSILINAHQQGISISALAGKLPERYTASNRLKNIPTELSNSRISALAESLADIETTFGKLCR